MFVSPHNEGIILVFAQKGTDSEPPSGAWRASEEEEEEEPGKSNTN